MRAARFVPLLELPHAAGAAGDASEPILFAVGSGTVAIVDATAQSHEHDLTAAICLGKIIAQVRTPHLVRQRFRRAPRLPEACRHQVRQLRRVAADLKTKGFDSRLTLDEIFERYRLTAIEQEIGATLSSAK